MDQRIITLIGGVISFLCLIPFILGWGAFYLLKKVYVGCAYMYNEIGTNTGWWEQNNLIGFISYIVLAIITMHIVGTIGEKISNKASVGFWGDCCHMLMLLTLLACLVFLISLPFYFEAVAAHS